MIRISPGLRFGLGIAAEFFIAAGMTISGAMAQQVPGLQAPYINQFTWPSPAVFALALVVGIVAAFRELKIELKISAPTNQGEKT